jgi:hypothetical protein
MARHWQAVVAGWWLLVAAALAGPTLTGTWSGMADGEALTVTFAAGGMGSANGEPMRWQVMGNLLFVEQGGEVLTYQFEQQGDRLSVAGGGFAAPVVLTRGAAVAKGNSNAAPATASAAKGSAAKGSAGADLVGKWCKGGAFSAVSGGGSSSMTCFELKADGSYAYEHEGSMSAYAPGVYGGTASQSSDRGQWSATAGTLTARSAQGAVSRYRLEKRNHPKNRDPMLCLDGDCYVTYWQKAPW